MKSPHLMQTEILLSPYDDPNRAQDVASFILRELYFDTNPTQAHVDLLVGDMGHRTTVVITGNSRAVLAAAGLVFKKNHNVAEVVDVIIEPGSRGIGLGKQIMQSLEELASKSHIDRLITFPTDGAVGFYENLGYSRHGEQYIRDLVVA